MTEREQIENEIRHLLATETRTTVLSNKPFQQGTGLFGKLASTEQERRVIANSDLFRAAQARVRELEYRDAAVLREAMKVLQAQFPGTPLKVILEDDTPTAS